MNMFYSSFIIYIYIYIYFFFFWEEQWTNSISRNSSFLSWSESLLRLYAIKVSSPICMSLLSAQFRHVALTPYSVVNLCVYIYPFILFIVSNLYPSQQKKKKKSNLYPGVTCGLTLISLAEMPKLISLIFKLCSETTHFSNYVKKYSFFKTQH